VIAIRKATPDDAEAIIAVLEEIASERVHTAINKPWSSGQQRSYLVSLSAREAIHVAQAAQEVVGYQTLELWAPTIDSMAHVGQLGTFLRSAWRRQGIGEALFRSTLDFARQTDYLKFVIQVRSSNTAAQSFYGQLGFKECGRLTRQVRMDGQEDDEILMQYFL
jgi:ribosomal protein S18 acetylase RimI-like enzyme